MVAISDGKWYEGEEDSSPKGNWNTVFYIIILSPAKNLIIVSYTNYNFSFMFWNKIISRKATKVQFFKKNSGNGVFFVVNSLCTANNYLIPWWLCLGVFYCVQNLCEKEKFDLNQLKIGVNKILRFKLKKSSSSK